MKKWLVLFSLLFVVSLLYGACDTKAPPKCDLLDCFGTCVDPASDAKNCGACGRSCKKGETCSQGICTSSKEVCPVGQIRCGDVCTDIQTNSFHCGACGVVCSDGGKCTNGKCETTSCTPPRIACGVICTDVQTNASHCGACFKVCPSGLACVKGVCKTEKKCTAPDVLCGERCVNIATDKANCGACNKKCQTGSLCQSGKCLSKPSGCSVSADCPKDRKCENRKCVPKVSGCQLDKDCAFNQLCQKKTGKCLTIPSGTVGAVCQEDRDCDKNLVCIQLSMTEGYCFQNCRSDADCARNPFRRSCLSIGKGRKVCMGYSEKGERCGYRGARQSQCRVGNNYPYTYLYCDLSMNVCTEVKVEKKEGGYCSLRRFPLAICDASLGLTCDHNKEKCIKVPTVEDGKACDATHLDPTKRIVCKEKYSLCSKLGEKGKLQRCHQVCSVSRRCNVSAGFSCYAPQGQLGLCLQKCKEDADCTYSNYRCQDFGKGDSFCTPRPASGPVPFGEVCDVPEKTKGCSLDPAKGGDSNAYCVRAKKNKPGFCSRICTKDNKCPTWKGTNWQTVPGVCQSVGQNGVKLCLFPCGQPGQKCPARLTCQNIGFMTCLAP